MAVAMVQPSLLGLGEPEIDPSFAGMQRIELGDGAWLDHLPGWMAGNSELFEILTTGLRWHHHRRPMFERIVDVPRLVAGIPGDGPGHPILDQVVDALAARYGVLLDRIGAAWYRDGHDSVAWHGDRVGRVTTIATVATVSLGEPRPFLVRPATGGSSTRFHLGHGDLVVMGGTMQRTHHHCVPKQAHAGPRVCVMFREAT